MRVELNLFVADWLAGCLCILFIVHLPAGPNPAIDIVVRLIAVADNT
jgi:hypothetical protein